jgi:hypothetical protein
MKNTELLGEYRAQYDAEIKRLEIQRDNLQAQNAQNVESLKIAMAEVEGMKCCGNCTYFYDNECMKFPTTVDGEYCDKWESDTLTQEDRK